jgi:hypothetical protein
MHLFNRTVDIILEKMIYEENNNKSDIGYADNFVNSTIDDIKKRMKSDPDSFLKDSENKYNSGQEVEDSFVKELSQIDKSINESYEDLKKDASNAWSLLKNKGKELWSSVADEIEDTQTFLADLAVENMGSIVRRTIGDEYIDDIKNNMSENVVYKIIAVLEPTGVMSWPYLAKAKEAYEANIGTPDEDIYQLNLLAAQISVIPGVRVPFRILTLPFRLLFGAPVFILRKIFGATGVSKISRSLAGNIKDRISTSAPIQKAVNVVSKASSNNTKLGKLSNTTAANAIKTLPKKSVKAVASATKNASKKVIDVAKKPIKAAASIGKKGAKIGATGAKVATVIGSGNIPQTLKDWENKGKEITDKLGDKEYGTFGKFPSYTRLSTQRF